MELVERDALLQGLEDRLRLVAGGTGHTVLIAGEAGIGKTSLLKALARRRGDADLWWGACDALQTPHPLAYQEQHMSSHELNSRAAARPTSANPIRSLGVGLLVASAAVGALAADKTVSVSERIDLAAAPSRTWDAIKDFKGWQAWHPAFASTEIVKGAGNTKGTVRVLTAKDGAKFTEELVSFNAASRTYQYHIIESPLPITGYVSTLEVKENKTGSSVVWSSNFKVKDGTPDEDSGLLEPANTDRGALRFEPRMFDVCATATDAVHACLPICDQRAPSDPGSASPVNADRSARRPWPDRAGSRQSPEQRDGVPREWWTNQPVDRGRRGVRRDDRIRQRHGDRAGSAERPVPASGTATSSSSRSRRCRCRQARRRASTRAPPAARRCWRKSRPPLRVACTNSLRRCWRHRALHPAGMWSGATASDGSRNLQPMMRER